jgi:DNA-binding PadR family transcriptional regulator
MAGSTEPQPALGDWACLGILYQRPVHGFSVAARLKPDADVGREWSLSRPLTYRSLEQLRARGDIRPIGEERGIAGGNRIILAATRQGRAALRTWLRTPVRHRAANCSSSSSSPSSAASTSRRCWPADVT